MTESLYSKLYDPHVVAKQRFVENFQAHAGGLDADRWTKVGASTFAMKDAVNGGFEISTTDGSSGYIWFNSAARHYSENGCVFIVVSKRSGGTPNAAQPFMINAAFTNFILMQNSTAFTNYQNETNDGATTRTDSGIATTENFTLHKMILDGTTNQYYIANILNSSKTTDLPTLRLQPMFRHASATGTKQVAIRYFEAYNT